MKTIITCAQCMTLHWILLPKTAYIIIKIVDKPEQVDV